MTFDYLDVIFSEFICQYRYPLDRVMTILCIHTFQSLEKKIPVSMFA